MHIKKAVWLGLSVVVILVILKYIGDGSFSLWQPFTNRYLGSVPLILQWGLGLILTILSIVALGFLVIITGSAQKFIQRFRAKRLQKNHRPEVLEKAGEGQPLNLVQKLIKFFWTKKLQKYHLPVALVKYGGDQLLCVILENHEDDYKVVVINPPAPISGQLLFVKRERLQFTSLTVADVLGQTTSFGFSPIFPKLGHLEDTQRHFRE